MTRPVYLLLSTRAPAAVALIRLYVGLIFACEGILSFFGRPRWVPADLKRRASPNPRSSAPSTESSNSAAALSFSLDS